VLDVFTAIFRRQDRSQCCVKDSGSVRDDLLHNAYRALFYFLLYMTLHLTLLLGRTEIERIGEQTY